MNDKILVFLISSIEITIKLVNLSTLLSQASKSLTPSAFLLFWLLQSFWYYNNSRFLYKKSLFWTFHNQDTRVKGARTHSNWLSDQAWSKQVPDFNSIKLSLFPFQPGISELNRSRILIQLIPGLHLQWRREKHKKGETLLENKMKAQRTSPKIRHTHSKVGQSRNSWKEKWKGECGVGRWEKRE